MQVGHRFLVGGAGGARVGRDLVAHVVADFVRQDVAQERVHAAGGEVDRLAVAVADDARAGARSSRVSSRSSDGSHHSPGGSE